MNPEQVLDEARPMLEDLLPKFGLCAPTTPLNLEPLLDPFSDWVATQDPSEENRPFFAGLIAAFMCEYLKECGQAIILVRDGRIYARSHVDQKHHVVREFEPHKVAWKIAQEGGSVSQILREISRQ